MPDFDRSPPPRPVHRYVPTLTEVVQPESLQPDAAPFERAGAPITPEVLEQIADASLRRAEAVLTQKLPELVSVLLHEQALAVSERVRREIRTVVRESITEALAELTASAGRPSAPGNQGPADLPDGWRDR